MAPRLLLLGTRCLLSAPGEALSRPIHRRHRAELKSLGLFYGHQPLCNFFPERHEDRIFADNSVVALADHDLRSCAQRIFDIQAHRRGTSSSNPCVTFGPRIEQSTKHDR